MANGTPQGGSASVWSEKLGQALELGYRSAGTPGRGRRPVGMAQAWARCLPPPVGLSPRSLSDTAPINFLFFSLVSPSLPTGSGWAQSGSMPTASGTPQCPQVAARRAGHPGTGA